ncbi:MULTISPECIES: hypothetical protein [Burkholderia]|uniref:Uncharacterized protein n=1 Tax=Burkholderia contaminans TaxID=488447 RepID=A0ABD7YGW5_9BURK|nr:MULTISPECIES: hypothetical protein [Burkholderia]QUN52866.1 hypothetical protein KEH59_41555 [Burkholderia contaminans]WFN23993.1 hypothetical protein LXE91_43015 [Burkholderia contaminans]
MNAGNFGALPAYAELEVASDFSFLHGASRAEEYGVLRRNPRKFRHSTL